MRGIAIAAFAVLLGWELPGSLLLAIEVYPQPPWCWLVGITSFADGQHANLFWLLYRAAIGAAGALAIKMPEYGIRATRKY